MNISNAEAQKRWRERQAQKRQDGLKKPDADKFRDFYREPFFEALDRNGNWSDVEISLDMAGIDAPVFDDDSGPKSATGEIEYTAEQHGELPFGGASNSLERAEVMVGSLIDAAACLASIINNYKKAEIRARISELEESYMDDPNERKAALSNLVRLTKALEAFNKKTRWTFEQWKLEVE